MSVTKLDKKSTPYDIAVTMEKIKGKGWNINASIMAAGAAYNKIANWFPRCWCTLAA